MSTLRNAVTRRRGMVLIIVLSVLAVMAILGISLLTLSALDRTVTDNHLHQVQARLSARSGVEDALARLRDGAVLRSAFDSENEWLYRGDDLDGTDPSKRIVPVAWGKLPSFPKKGVNGLNETVDIWRDDMKASVKVGVSGTSAGKFHQRSNVYSLEVRDLSSCIYLNDGVHLYGANNSSVSQNLGRILNRLGDHSKVNISRLGDLVLRVRPSTGFASMQDFRTALKIKGSVTDLQLDRLERFVTTTAWIDKNVVNPAPLSQAVVNSYPVKYERGQGDAYVFRRGPGRDHENEDRSKDSRLGWMPDFGGLTGLGGISTKVYGHDELYPTYVEVTHRAPININTAEEPVLIALLADLKGFFVLERRGGHPFGGNTPTRYNYSALWPSAGASNGVWPAPEKVSISQEQGWFTFENMGHTYSDHKWKARTRVDDNMDWQSLWGATTKSTLEQVKDDSNIEKTEDHDALGDLWITQSLSAGDGSGTVSGGVSALAVAREIMACRNRQGRYAAAAFGGPFKTWAQFHAFCDNLVEIRKDGTPGAGILRDDRFGKDDERRQAAQAMADMLKANFNPNFTPNETNPDHNLHLLVDKTDLVVNSTEFCFLPTGLFSISSAGRVLRDRHDGKESRRNGPDSGMVPQEIVAQSRIDAVVRAYEVYRETSQRHFYAGEATPAEDASYTNNGLTVETGPEPDQGPLLYNEHLGHDAKFIKHSKDVDDYAGDSTIEGEVMSGWGYEASGYMALPTRGGIGTVKRKGEILKMEVMGPKRTAWDQANNIKEIDLTMRASFRLNDTLDYSLAAKDDKVYCVNAATAVLKAGSVGDALVTISEYVYNPATCSGQVITRVAGGSLSKLKIEQTSNFADPGEEAMEADGGARLSPYDPTDGTRYRLVRSYRLPLSSVPGAAGAGKTVAAPLNVGTESLPRMPKAAPSDLRVDGYYSERHSGLAYWLWEQMVANERSFSTFQGTATFWFKPNFDPAYTGKVRSLASVSRYHRKNFYYRNPSPFTLFFMPAFNGGTGDETKWAGQPEYDGNGEVANASAPAFSFKKVPVFRTSDYRRLTTIPRSSLVFQISYSTFDGMGWGSEDIWQPGQGQSAANNPFTPGWAEAEMFYVTNNLNKRALDRGEDDKDLLRAHRWSHIGMTWWIGNPTSVTAAPPQGERIEVTVNGLAKGNQVFGSYTSAQNGLRAYGVNTPASEDRKPRVSDTDFMDHAVGQDGPYADERWHFPGDRWTEPTDRFILNTIRLGEASTHSFTPETFTRNFSSDGTYDEFYFWKDTQPSDMGSMGLSAAASANNVAGKKFLQGRYHVPLNGENDAAWTSPELVLRGPNAARELANPTKSVATGAAIRADKGGVGMTTTENSRITTRLLGVSWTWYAEKYATEITGNTLGGAPSLVPVMVDYQNPDGPSDLKQEKSCARLFVMTDQLVFPANDPNGLANDAFSPIQDQAGQPVSLGSESKFKYQVKFRIEGADMSTVLLSTPVLDDVTFFYLTPESGFLQYVERGEID